MLTDAFLARLSALRLAMRGRAVGGAGGSRRSRQTGSSAEFSDYREYIPGDDIRRLDWNALARFDRLYMKLFMEEQESQVSILLDASASMGADAAAPSDAGRASYFSSAAPGSKWAAARSAAEALGYLALSGGDRLRLYLLKDGRAFSSPQLAGRVAFARLTAFLDACVPDGREGTLTGAVRHLEGLRKGLSFLITDGYTDDALKEPLDYLRFLRQETTVVQVLSGEELRPELEGALRLTDCESGEHLDLLADRAALEAYREALDDFLKAVRENCSAAEARYLLLDSSQPFDRVFIPLLSAAGILS
jgi:uncharacterized protein (DUF58 family)